MHTPNHWVSSRNHQFQVQPLLLLGHMVFLRHHHVPPPSLILQIHIPPQKKHYGLQETNLLRHPHRVSSRNHQFQVQPLQVASGAAAKNARDAKRQYTLQNLGRVQTIRDFIRFVFLVPPAERLSPTAHFPSVKTKSIARFATQGISDREALDSAEACRVRDRNLPPHRLLQPGHRNLRRLLARRSPRPAPSLPAGTSHQA